MRESGVRGETPDLSVRGVGGREEWGGGSQWEAFLLLYLSSLPLVPGLATHFGPSVMLSYMTFWLLPLAKLEKMPPNKKAT